MKAGFHRSDFAPRQGLADAATIFLAWALPGFAFVLLADLLGADGAAAYLHRAISEGIEPHLWNVMALIGALLFAAALMAPGRKRLAFAANRVLVNVYGIGSLMFGLLGGQFAAGMRHATLGSWSEWLFGVSFPGLFALIFVVNALMWYAGFLVYRDQGSSAFMRRMRGVHVSARIALAVVIVALPLMLMVAER